MKNKLLSQSFIVAPEKTDAFWKLMKEGPSAEQAVKEVKEKIRKRMNKPDLAFIVDPSKVEEFFRINKESPKSINRAIKRMEAKLKALKEREKEMTL